MIRWCVFMVGLATVSRLCLGELIVNNAERVIDLSTQLVKVNLKLQIENPSDKPEREIEVAVEPELVEKVSWINVDKPTGSSITALNSGRWKVSLKDPIKPKQTVTVHIDFVLTDSLEPYPTEILQREKQLVRFRGNGKIFLPYQSKRQSTVFHLGTRNVESFTKNAQIPSSLSDTNLNYGPITNVPPLSKEPIVIHYENNAPFIKVTRIERVLEVSHWGNIAVEETIDMVHTGAKLKGPFSRYDLQREAQSGLPSVKVFRTLLPASATDAYYRDDIGNISTSNMRILSDSVELELRPRFPLFGGWKTHYVLGYNVPSYEYLYHAGDSYKLVMRVLDHIYDDMVVDELVTKIILPEGAADINLIPPYPMTRLPDSRHSTYLDTKGRPVISITKRNLVEQHIQSFELDYAFPRILMLQEPLLVVGAVYILFLLVVIYVRLDFSISKDELSEVRLRLSGLLDKLYAHLDRRAAVYSQFDSLLAKVKTTKDTSSFLSQVKTLNAKYKAETTAIAELLNKLRVDGPSVANKVQEIQNIDSNLREMYNQKQSLYVDKLLAGKIGRSAFVDAENDINKRKEDLAEKINTLVKNLFETVL